jgi:ASC-1-like (ASCH) protein
MSTITVQLSDPWFDLTRRGLKIYEGRVNIEKYQQLVPGDTIVFWRRGDNIEPSFRVAVKQVLKFPTFRDALITLGVDKVLPVPGLTLQAGCDIYEKYVSLETQNLRGVLMIQIERLPV